MLSNRRILAPIVLAMFLGILATGIALAADTKAEFASIDLEKAFDGYTKKVTLETQLAAEFAQVKQWFELRGDNKLLTDEEFNKLATLTGKTAPTDADKKDIQALKDLSKQRVQEFTTLQQKTSPTDVEKARLNELNAMGAKVEATIKDEVTKKQDDLNKKRADLSQQVMKDVQAMVETVAKDKGLVMVFNKSVGDSGLNLVLYCNLDITDEVLKRLNKK